MQTANTLVGTVSVAEGSTIPDSALFSLVVPTLPSLTSVDITTTTQVKLYSKSTLSYIIVDQYGNLQTLGDNKAAGATFSILPKSGGGYTLQSNNKYTTADGGGTGPLMANRDTASGWETFYFNFRSADSTYTITAAANNQLVAALNNDVWFQLSPTVPNSGTIPDSAIFYIVAA